MTYRYEERATYRTLLARRLREAAREAEAKLASTRMPMEASRTPPRGPPNAQLERELADPCRCEQLGLFALDVKRD
jgi:hypothetical protein